jgi:hypothetical protein
MVKVMSEIRFEIKNHIATLSEKSSGWKKELNLVSWNGREAKYDLREWNEDHSSCHKGCTLSDEELKALKEVLSHLDI